VFWIFNRIKLPNKINNGYVYPKEVKRMLEKYGFQHLFPFVGGEQHIIKESDAEPVNL